MGSALGAAIVTGAGFTALLYATTWLKALKNSETVGKYLAEPLELVSPITITVLCCLLLWVGLSTARTRVTMRRFGVRLFSRHYEDTTREKDWQLICNDLRAAATAKDKLRLLGCTGAATFAESNAPLHHLLQSYSGTICILLVCPDSAGFRQRVDKLNENDGAFKREIFAAIDYCQLLQRAHGRRIELRLYHDVPIWKMIITDSALWVWHYEPKHDVHRTPLYGFALSGEPSGLLNGFDSVFERRWTHSSTVKVNLEKWSRDKWQKQLVPPNTIMSAVKTPTVLRANTRGPRSNSARKK